MAADQADAGLLSQGWQQTFADWLRAQLDEGHNDILNQATAQFERTAIQIALQATAGQRQEAAKRLGWGRNTLTRKIKELGID